MIIEELKRHAMCNGTLHWKGDGRWLFKPPIEVVLDSEKETALISAVGVKGKNMGLVYLIDKGWYPIDQIRMKE